MDSDSSHSHQEAEGHHIAQASEGSTAIVGEEIHVHLCPRPLISRSVVSTDPVDLVAELAEWKLIHNETQVLLNALSIPFDYLTACRFEPDRKKLDDAGFKWQRLCVPKLKDVPDRWNLQHANTPALDDLREQTLKLEEITRKLMQMEAQGIEFTSLYLQFEEFRGILWDLLTAADKRIMVLVEILKPMIGG